MARGGLGAKDIKILLIIVVCGVIGIALTMMLNLAVTNDIIVLSVENTRRFSTLIILMSIMLGTIIGIASGSNRSRRR